MSPKGVYGFLLDLTDLKTLDVVLVGRLAQLVRALPLQGRGHRFEPCSAHHETISTKYELQSIILGRRKKTSAKFSFGFRV